MTSRQLIDAYVGSDFALVAEDAKSIVGFLFGWPLPYGRLVANALAIRRDARRKGVAGALYSELPVRARAAGLSEVRALISEDNVASQCLHSSQGFSLRRRVEAVLELD